ncbi:MAG: NUDIX hydrolase, partial [Caldilineae bacterium]
MSKKPVKAYRAAGGVVIDEQGRVLLLERHVQRENTSSHEIRLPKGHIEKGESAAQAARREVGEESGYWGVAIMADLGENRVEFELRGRQIRRRERYFLMRLTDARRGEPRPSHPNAEEALFRPLW